MLRTTRNRSLATIEIRSLVMLALLLTGCDGTDDPANPGPGSPAQADIEVEAAGPATTRVGEEPTYSVIIQNQGPDAAVEVEASATVEGVAAQIEALDGGSVSGSSVVWPTRPTLGSGATATLRLRLLPEEVGEVTVSATVAADTDDPDPSNNAGAAASVTTLVDPPAPAATAQLVWLVDAGNVADGSDLLVRFRPPSNPTGIEGYRIVIAPSAQAAGLTPEGVRSLPADRTLDLEADAAEASLDFAGLSDANGDPIVEGTAYRAVALSLAGPSRSDALSAPSEEATLAQADFIRTITEPIDAGTGGMDVDAAGLIYFADFGPTLGAGGGDRVFQITPAGDVSVWATGLNGASGNAFDSNGDLFQSNINIGVISRITPDGTVSSFASTGLVAPVGIAIDAADTLFVANCGNNTLRKVAPDGTSLAWAADNLLSCPNGITLASDGAFYVANFNDGNVLRVTRDGAVSPFVTLPGANNGHILAAGGVLWVAGRGAQQIFRVTLAGDVTVAAGTGTRGLRDGAPAQATLSLTNDLSFSPDGSTLYFNDVALPGPGGQTITPTVIRMLVFVP